MTELLARIATAAGLFIGTNVDDLLVLTVLFLTFRAKGRPLVRDIVLGQYLGVGALVIISLLAALGLALVPGRWIGLLGLLPLTLGLISLVKAFRHGAEKQNMIVSAVGLIGIAGLTIANGADNLTLYTPAFRGLNVAGVVVTVAVFALMTGLWCWLAAQLGAHKKLVATIDRFGHWTVPWIFVGIGAAILLKATLA
ncbi:MAG TPA: cadmium resistance transporter [Candidatus Saccharimonadales bacterium]|nr:cadmium resistance transporter [Candidatus Saccharimonadales bacterium]